MRTRKLALTLVICAASLLAAIPAASAQGFIPITPQTLNLGSGGAGTLTAIKITNIGVVNGQLVASGLATVNTASGTAIGVFQNQPLAASTVASKNSCPHSAPGCRTNSFEPFRIGCNHQQDCVGHHGGPGRRQSAWQSALRSRQLA